MTAPGRRTPRSRSSPRPSDPSPGSRPAPARHVVPLRDPGDPDGAGVLVGADRRQKQAVREFVGPNRRQPSPAAYHRRPGLDTYQQTSEPMRPTSAREFGRPSASRSSRWSSGKDDPGGAWAWAEGQLEEVPAGSHATRLHVQRPDRDGQRLVACAVPALGVHPRGLALLPVHDGRPRDVREGAAVGDRRRGQLGRRGGHRRGRCSAARGRPLGAVRHRSGKSLYTRAYDAVGFHPQLVQNGINPWTVLPAMVSPAAATRHSRPPAPRGDLRRPLGLELVPRCAALDRLGDERRLGSRRDDPCDARGDPARRRSDETISAKPNAAAIADIHTTAFITRIEVAGGGRVADPGSAASTGLRAATLDLVRTRTATASARLAAGHARTPPESARRSLRGRHRASSTTAADEPPRDLEGRMVRREANAPRPQPPGAPARPSAAAATATRTCARSAGIATTSRPRANTSCCDRPTARWRSRRVRSVRAPGRPRSTPRSPSRSTATGSASIRRTAASRSTSTGRPSQAPTSVPPIWGRAPSSPHISAATSSTSPTGRRFGRCRWANGGSTSSFGHPTRFGRRAWG